MEYLREVLTTNLHVLLREDDILETRYRDDWNDIENLEHAQENVEAIKEVIDGKLYPMISYMPSGLVSRDARQYYSKQEPYALAGALIALSTIHVIIANLFIHYTEIEFPMRMFKDEEMAIKWLKNQPNMQFSSIGL